MILKISTHELLLISFPSMFLWSLNTEGVAYTSFSKVFEKHLHATVLTVAAYCKTCPDHFMQFVMSIFTLSGKLIVATVLLKEVLCPDCISSIMFPLTLLHPLIYKASYFTLFQWGL